MATSAVCCGPRFPVAAARGEWRGDGSDTRDVADPSRPARHHNCEAECWPQFRTAVRAEGDAAGVAGPNVGAEARESDGLEDDLPRRNAKCRGDASSGDDAASRD